MVSNLVVRNKRTGYVTFVAKARVNGDSRTVEYICGLGAMDQTEFKAFQKWAHSIKDQKMRRERVLACPFVVLEGKRVTAKVAEKAQKKTTVKRAKKKIKPDDSARIEAKAQEREAFRKQYEQKKHLKVKRVNKVVSVNGIRFTGRKTLSEKKRVLTERITELDHRIANAKAEIRGWQRDRSSGWKISDTKTKVERYEETVKRLRKQRSEMRRQ